MSDVLRAGVFVIFILLSATVSVRALEPNEMLPDAAEEAHARALSAELRCLVCQNQSIDDSDAQLARDLRKIVRQRVAAGDSDEAIKAFLVDRFGEFVLLRPIVSAKTWLLWSLPFIALVGGAAGIVLSRRRAKPFETADLDGSERAALERVLNDHVP